MADDLIAMFASITTDDHDALVQQFSKVLQIEKKVAQFFLESSSWNVETAINTFLASVGSKANLLHVASRPSGELVCQPEFVKGGARVEPGTRLSIMLHLKNSGPVEWPRDTRLVFVDGTALTDTKSIMVPLLKPGASTFFNLEVGPLYRAQDYVGAYRLKFRGGYMSDAVWIMLTVVPAAEPAIVYPASHAVGDFRSRSHAAAAAAGAFSSPPVDISMSGAAPSPPPPAPPAAVAAPAVAAPPVAAPSFFAPSTFAAPAATGPTGAPSTPFTFTGFAQPPSATAGAPTAAPAFGGAGFGATGFGGAAFNAPAAAPAAPAAATAMAMDEDDDMMDI